jgi:hypothetical protein
MGNASEWPKIVTLCAYGSRDGNWETGERLGYPEETLWTFRHALNELEVRILANEDGTYKILEIWEGEQCFLPKGDE